MGLDVSHDCWHGPYSQFSRWRTWLARQCGIPLPFMRGHAEWVGFEQADADAVRVAMRDDPDRGIPLSWLVRNAACLPASWDAIAHPLKPLLHHSDCDGRIKWWWCRDIALALLRVWRESKEPIEPQHADTHRGCYDGMLPATLRFAAGCRRAWLAREDVTFA